MILIVIFLIVTLGFGWGCYKLFDDYDHVILSVLTLVASFIFGTITLISSCILVNKTITESSVLAAYQVRYESLMYQLDMYDGKDYSKRDLYSAIERWNCDLVRIKTMRENFFIRDFVYDVSGLQLIPFPNS